MATSTINDKVEMNKLKPDTACRCMQRKMVHFITMGMFYYTQFSTKLLSSFFCS